MAMRRGLTMMNKKLLAQVPRIYNSININLSPLCRLDLRTNREERKFSSSFNGLTFQFLFYALRLCFVWLLFFSPRSLGAAAVLLFFLLSDSKSNEKSRFESHFSIWPELERDLFGFKWKRYANFLAYFTRLSYTTWKKQCLVSWWLWVLLFFFSACRLPLNSSFLFARFIFKLKSFQIDDTLHSHVALLWLCYTAVCFILRWRNFS